MPVFPYYNPYRRNNNFSYFYNPYNYKYTYGRNFSPNLTQPNNQTVQEEIQSNRNSNSKKPNDENVWLDIFGIKLYYDDILILSLLFFLYEEKVKDEGLFLALILLLIS